MCKMTVTDRHRNDLKMVLFLLYKHGIAKNLNFKLKKLKLYSAERHNIMTINTNCSELAWMTWRVSNQMGMIIKCCNGI